MDSSQSVAGRRSLPGGAAPQPGEWQVIWVIWLTYGAFYFCRTNLSAAVPGMQEPVAAGGLGLSKEDIGWILASLKISYAIGQLLNGQLSERFSPRLLLAVGMLCSAGLNVLFGFGTAAYFLLFVWACNGYCQSLGWTPCVRVVANWIPPHRRGNAIGIIGTGYQITVGLTFIIAGTAAEILGWRGALYVPAALLALCAIFMLLFLKESPDESTGSTAGEGTARHVGPSGGSFVDNVLVTFFNPALWILAISLGLLNACRYGFLDWGITHLTETQGSGVGTAALKYAVIAPGAAAGSLLAGWATDRFFGSRRAPVICILLLALAGLTLVYARVAEVSVAGTLVLLFLIGFCIYGPQVLLVGTAPADLARRGTSAAAAGFVNCIGYIGASTGDVVTGRLLDNYDWQVAISFWAGCALAAAFVSAGLWRVGARNEEGA